MTVNAADEAKVVYTNGVVYTVQGDDWDKKPQESIAISADGKILYVGDNDGVAAYIGDDTEVIDLEGNVVLPGFIDTHVHPPGIALTELFSIDLYGATSRDQLLETIADYIEEHPDLDVYWGTGFSMGLSGEAKGPKKEWLDEICDDKPIILTSNDGHNQWLNSKAFEANGITKDTPNPPGGTVQKDDSGELWGVLTDAFSLVEMAQEFTPAQQREALEVFQDSMHAWGYTAGNLIIMSLEEYASTGSEYVDYMVEMERAGTWKMHSNLMLRFIPENDFKDDLAFYKKTRDSIKNSQIIKVTTAKFFMDGVVEGQTAYLSEPYAPEMGLEPDYVGEPYWDVEELKGYFATLGKEGIQIHVHSIGDQATSETIDAMEYAQAQNPRADLRNTITHLQVVKDSDKVRMGKLGIIGSTQPYWHLKEPDWYEYIDEVALGPERAWKEYPVKSLIDAGVIVTFSGDHPVSPVNNPFWAIQAAVTRNLYAPEDYYGVDPITSIDDPTWLLNPAERITVKQAIEAYTINGAYQLFAEDRLGSLAAGKSADMIIVSQDPIKADPLTLDATEVLATVFRGETIYEISSGSPFDDVDEDAWYFDAVMCAYESGLMNGTSVDPPLFSPDASLTRGMAVTVLYRLEGNPAADDYGNPFSDVKDSAWYADAVKWAAENDIVEGIGGGLFAPKENLTREQMAAIFYRYANNVDKDTEGDWTAGLDFTDMKKTATRAEFATALMEFMNGEKK